MLLPIGINNEDYGTRKRFERKDMPPRREWIHVCGGNLLGIGSIPYYAVRGNHETYDDGGPNPAHVDWTTHVGRFIFSFLPRIDDKVKLRLVKCELRFLVIFGWDII